MNIVCRQCGKEFEFSEAEREFYEQKGFLMPQRCKECRSKKQNGPRPLVCSHCAAELDKEASIYCKDCLSNEQLGYEMKIQKMQAVLDETFIKLKAVQSRSEELEALLSQKEQTLGELKLETTRLSQDLEKANQLQITLNQWFQPTLNGIEERVVERLETLEKGQSKINERMIQMAQRVYDLFENVTLLRLIKRSIKGNHPPDPRTT